ncbi:DUF2867 domain-containing protein [Streptomyces sp. NPDC004111]|uniref:DUF2867 domain-containing protein n=1 Tax=Streptomyces sp. NPDC004111 TaxID=3364690 RepID=UPI003677B5D1
MATKLPTSAHTGRPWRIHEIAGDFRVEDVWAFRTPGAGPGDFAAMLAAMRAAGGPARQTAPVRFLFAVRWKLGALLGWDTPEAGTGGRVDSLRRRMPADLREAPQGPDDPDMPLKPLYELDDEAARELANKTVHTVMHLSWVAAGDGDHELRMAVLVKPNGTFGRLYMAGIAPFRHLLVYPALTRQWERAWREFGPAGPEAKPAGSTGRVPAGAVARAVGSRVPPRLRALSSMPDFDYADAFSLATDSAERTPEQWARAMFGDVPGPGERLIWRGLLGLRLDYRRGPDTVAGWRVAARGEDWIRLETASWFLTGNLVVRTAEGRVTLVTFLRYDRLLGRIVWPPLSAVHRGLVPGVLRGAAAKSR